MHEAPVRCLFAYLILVALGCDAGGAAEEKGGAGAAAEGGGAGDSGAPAAEGGKGGQLGAGRGGAHASSGGAGAGAGGDVGTGMIKLVPNVVSGKKLGQGGSGGVGAKQSALRIGTPSETTLLSLKYYIRSIQLCEDVELMGSGYSQTHGCISLYENMTAESPEYNVYTVTQAQADTTPGRYIDLMSADGQAALRKPVMLRVPIAQSQPEAPLPADPDADAGVPESPQRQPGVYRFGLINFYRPIKAKVEFPIIGETSDHYFRTKAVTATHDNTPSGGLPSQRVEIGDTLSGATEETTYMLNNGGALFVFQKPFVITQADLDAQAEILIDLVFNPESFGQAYTTDCAADARVVVCDPVNNVALDMPFVHMSPVPRKKGEKTRKETYLVDYDASSKLRIELYYNDSDAESSIQGVDTAIVYTTAPAGNLPSFNIVASNFVTQQGSVRTDDASVSLLDYQRQTSLQGLARRHDGTLTLHCLFPGSICNTLHETLSRAYTYVGDSLVSE